MFVALVALVGMPLALDDHRHGAGIQDRAGAPQLDALAACSGLPDGARLECYDAAATALLEAVRENRVAVRTDPDPIRSPEDEFGRRGDVRRAASATRQRRAREEVAFTEITSTIATLQPGANGWVFTLANGARWAQSDTVSLIRTPRQGDTIRVRRGPVGNYLANIARGPAIRVRRVD